MAGGRQAQGTGLQLTVALLLAEGAMRAESSVGLAHGGWASHPHSRYEWPHYGLE